jgi:hypothetical protein
MWAYKRRNGHKMPKRASLCLCLSLAATTTASGAHADDSPAAPPSPTPASTAPVAAAPASTAPVAAAPASTAPVAAAPASTAPEAAAAATPATAPSNDETAAWWDRYELARKRLLSGEYLRAAEELRDLADSAPTPKEKALVIDLAQVAEHWSARADSEPPGSKGRRLRTTDEITLFGASAFLYGVGTGTWFLLQTQPKTALTGTLPFAAIAAAPVVAVAIIDSQRPFSRGIPHAISAGLYLGLGQGIWVVGYEHSRAIRLNPGVAGARWSPEIVSTVLWSGATLGGVAAGVIGRTIPTTPGRISYTTSTTTWSGVLSGFAAAAIVPDRTDLAFASGGIGYNAGLLGGLLSAGAVSPSVARVRLTDLSGLAGGLLVGGLYMSVAQRDAVPRVTYGLAGAGAAAGLALGWFLTRGMQPELPETVRAPQVVLQPTFSPTAGGGTLGLAGSM